MKRVAIGSALVLFAATSYGDCTGTLPLKRELKDSDVVVIATVLSSHPVPQSWYAFDGTDYLLHVDQTIKSKRSGEITIFSEHSEDGYDLKTGTQYLLFLTSNYDHLVVNRCGNSGPMEEEGKVIKELIHLAGND